MRHGVKGVYGDHIRGDQNPGAQKYPFLMVDQGPRPETGKRAVAIKNITGNEIFFLGHFQTWRSCRGTHYREYGTNRDHSLPQSAEATGRVFDDDQTLFFFGGAKVRFLKPVVPGDQLQIGHDCQGDFHQWRGQSCGDSRWATRSVRRTLFWRQEQGGGATVRNTASVPVE